MRIKSVVPLVLILLAHAICAEQIPANPPSEVVSLASKVFKEYDSGHTLDQFVASAKPDDTILIHQTFDPRPGGEVFNPNSKASAYPHHHIRLLTATSDFIGTGIPVKRWSFATDDKQFLFSIYLVQVTEVVWSGADQIQQGAYIYVAHAGGILTYRGHKVVAFDPEFQFFHLNDEYIFFGHRVAGSLFKVDSEHTLLLKDGLVSETSTHVHHAALFRDMTKNQLLSEAHTATQFLKSAERKPQ